MDEHEEEMGDTKRRREEGFNKEGGEGPMMAETKCTMEGAIHANLRETIMIERRVAINENLTTNHATKCLGAAAFNMGNRLSSNAAR